MKKILPFVGIITFFSCTSVVYTHKQVMDEIKTKDQVITKFGLPNSKMTEGEYEQWYYDYGMESRSRTSTTYTKPEINNTVNVNINTNSNSGINWNPTNQTSVPKFNLGNSYGSTVTTTKNKYVKIIFRGDAVVSWETQAVDFSIKGTNRVGNALLLGPVGLLINSSKN
jgi:hypothetical protein